MLPFTSSRKFTQLTENVSEETQLKAVTPFKEVTPPEKAPAAASAADNTDVFVRLMIFSISDIDTVMGTFGAEFYLTATWLSRRERASFADLSQTELADALVQDFDPRLIFMNSGGPVDRTDERWELDSWRTGNNGEPVVSYRCRCVGTFREPLELSQFPFDTQPLNLVLSSHSTAVTLHEDPGMSRLRTEFMSSPEFELRSIDFFRTRSEGTLIRYPLLYIAVIARRRPGYYVWNTFVPTLLLTLMAASIFTVPASDAAGRLGLILTLVLTSVAFKFVVSQSLPKIPYNTSLDWYVLGSFVILALIVVEVSVVALVDEIDATIAPTVERWLLAALAVLVFVGHAALGLLIWWWGRCTYGAGPSRRIS